jgi:hypothetical protein
MATVATLTGWEHGDWAERLIGLPGADDQDGLTDEEKADAHLLIECLPERDREKAVPKEKSLAVTFIKRRLKAGELLAVVHWCLRCFQT